MSTTVTPKFSVGDICYTFDSTSGIISRSIVHEITVNLKLNDTEVLYILKNTQPDPKTRTSAAPEYEQTLLTEAEVKEVANTWLINKSVSIFSNAGL